MGDVHARYQALAEHLAARRSAILEAWGSAIRRDPSLTTSDALPRGQLFDHIPAMLGSFEEELRGGASRDGAAAAQESAAAHGLQRWQQGYDLREVTRELGKLNECVVAEIDAFAAAAAPAGAAGMEFARRIWAGLCSTAIEESVGEYFKLQQQEASGHVRDLEAALVEIRTLEQQRADLWRQAAHDLRGNLGVVANATVGLTHGGAHETVRDDFVRILMRNVTMLHHLLDDVTSLARLQAGREQRQVELIDVSPLLHQLCEGIRPLAQQRRLFLRSEGPAGFAADGDAVKIRRIAQNLILNAVKFTRDGGITVSWGGCGAEDPGRWELCVSDTGPGFQPGSGEPLAQAIAAASDAAASDTPPPRVTAESRPSGPEPSESGEGIGLSIVKRLCELLDATIELKSVKDVGTTFRIVFPRHYAQ